MLVICTGNEWFSIVTLKLPVTPTGSDAVMNTAPVIANGPPVGTLLSDSVIFLGPLAAVWYALT